MALRPLDLVASMVLEAGGRWGECATPSQWADMRALLSPGSPRRHFWLRPRGASKTFDAGAATIAVMLTGAVRAGDEMYAAAAGKEQAGLLARKIRAIAENTPELAGAVEVQQHRVITKRSGAVLDVLSSELATSWGKTPRWLVIDEICNHESGERERTFITALLTSLIKRRDSVCLAGSTPSAPTHWSRELWDQSVASALWRTSVTDGPTPWQDPEELADERANLPDFMYRRLFLCEWAAADDALADDVALAECTRHSGPLAYERGAACVVAFDLSSVKDHTAVSVAHAAERGGRSCVVIDRLQAWVPPKGGQVDLADVEEWISRAAREYGGAMIVGDPWQAIKMMRSLRDAGHQVKPVPFTAQANSRRAQMLLRLVRDRDLDIPDDADLRREFLSLRLAEGTTPGVLHLTSDGSSKGHYDRVTSVMLAAEELLSRPTSSWRDYNGKVRDCQACGRAYLVARQACVFCSAANPDAPEKDAKPLRAASELAAPQPGGWASAYLPADARRCPNDHLYAGSHGESCPHCARRGQGAGMTGLPPGLLAVLGRR